MEKIPKLGKLGKLRLRPPRRSERDIGQLPNRTERDPAVADVMALIQTNDEAFAKRMMGLKENMPYATYPELITWDWLNQRGENFVYQAQFNGGRQLRGGQVPDFVINQGGEGLVWRVQGEYWHTLGHQRDIDITGRIQMLGRYVNGLRVSRIVDLWEHDIYTRNPEIFNMAMAGIGMRS